MVKLTHASALALVLGCAAAACGGDPPGPPPTVPSTSTTTPLTTPAAPEADRDPADKKLDAGRKPSEMLAFYNIKPGMKVAELAAGGGYTTELLARAVSPNGTVYSQNSQWIVDKFADKPWTERLAKPVNKNVVRVVRAFEDPFPPEAKDLDAVFIVLFYHDTVWLEVDRAKMNASVLRVLKPGGEYAIIDHSGRPGTGTTESKTTHRIEESVVRDEVTKAGFKLAGEGDFLRNKDDARDWNASPMAAAEKRGTSDRFVLKFVRP